MIWFQFFVCALAVWRLSSLFARESGPYKMFDRIRIALYTASIKRQYLQTFSDGIACMWCNSMWMSALVSLYLSHGIIEWAVITLALSTAAIFLEELHGYCENIHAPKP